MSDFLTLFSARAGELFWFQSRPAPIVGTAAFVALGTSTMIACFFPVSVLDHMAVEGLALNNPKGELTPLWVWLYCIAWWWIQDVCKVLTYRCCTRYNIFGYRDDGHMMVLSSPTTQQTLPSAQGTKYQALVDVSVPIQRP